MKAANFCFRFAVTAVVSSSAKDFGTAEKVCSILLICLFTIVLIFPSKEAIFWSKMSEIRSYLILGLSGSVGYA
jgi:hypothetical protein